MLPENRHSLSVLRRVLVLTQIQTVLNQRETFECRMPSVASIGGTNGQAMGRSSIMLSGSITAVSAICLSRLLGKLYRAKWPEGS